jgi:hypothetical protein
MNEGTMLDDDFSPGPEWPAEDEALPSFEQAEPVQLKALAVSYDRKFNQGNFESLHPAMTIWVRTVASGDLALDLHGVMRRLREMVRENVRAQLYRLQGKPEAVFLGLLPPDDDGPDSVAVTTVSLSLGYRANLGHYESIAPAYTDWVDVRYLSSNQAELHIALQRIWDSLWANIEDEINRARGLGSDPAAFFGLPEVEIEDLTSAGSGEERAAPPATAGANGYPGNNRGHKQ